MIFPVRSTGIKIHKGAKRQNFNSVRHLNFAEVIELAGQHCLILGVSLPFRDPLWYDLDLWWPTCVASFRTA